MSLIIRTTGVEDYLDGGEARVKCLILGAPGVGKTRSASFWPKPILLDCEDGRMSVADRQMPYVRIESSSDMKTMLEKIRLDSLQPVNARQWETVIIDTLDAYQRIVTQERLAITKNEGLTGWADWGFLDGKMQQLVVALQAMRSNVVVNLHVKSTKVGKDEDGDGGYMEQGPKLKGDLRDQIGAEFDLVGFMGTYFENLPGTTERVQKRGIQWWPSPDRPGCKDRSGQLPQFTSVTFAPEDYDQLFWPMQRHAQELMASQELETVATEPVPQPVGPLPGGPVGPKVPVAVTPAPVAVAPAAAPAPPAVTPAPTTVTTPPVAAAPAVAAPTSIATNVPAAARPDAGASPAPAPAPVPAPAPEPVAEAGPPPTEAEAVATVVGTLGGEVIEEPPAADEPVVMAVTGTDAVEVAAEVAAVMTPAVAPDVFPVCGDVAVEGATPVAGCGKLLPVWVEGGKYLTNDSEINADLVEIGVLKHRTWLCNEDFRAANKKGA